MLLSFRDQASEDLFDGTRSRKARQRLPVGLWRQAQRKLLQLDTAESLDDLKAPPGNRLELLVGDRAGQHSIRINDQYRICFAWTVDGPGLIEVVDYH